MHARRRSGTLQALFCALALTTGCTGGNGAGQGVDEQVIRNNILGTAQLGQTKWSEAEAEFRRALARRPQDPLLLTNTAIAVNQQERSDEAMELLAGAVAADPQYVPAHFNMGLIESRRGDFEQAARHFETVAALDDDELFTRYFLGTSLARIGREAEGIEALRGALELDPTHVSTLYALGRLLLQQGQQDEGMELITRSQVIRSRSGLDEAVGSEYGEQGCLSRAANYPGGTLEAPEPIAVRFELGERVETGDDVRVTVVPGAALHVAVGGTLRVAGREEPVAELGEGTVIVALAAGDADNDGTVDLALLTTRSSQAGATLEPAWLRTADGVPLAEVFGGQPTTTLSGSVAGSDLTFVDTDHDGDLDLFWCWTAAVGPGGCKLATNDGEGRFDVRASGEHGFDPAFGAAGPVSVAFSDIDNDRDVDLLVAGPGGIRLFTNERDGSFDESQAGPADAGGAVNSRANGFLNCGPFIPRASPVTRTEYHSRARLKNKQVKRRGTIARGRRRSGGCGLVVQRAL